MLDKNGIRGRVEENQKAKVKRQKAKVMRNQNSASFQK
jgi:hypothetical protein